MSCEKVEYCPKCNSTDIVVYPKSFFEKALWCNKYELHYEYRKGKVITVHEFLYRDDSGNIRKCPKHKLPLEFAEKLDENDEKLYDILLCPKWLQGCDYEVRYNRDEEMRNE